MRKKDILREALREVGRLGGKASAKNLTAKQRTERARKAGKARQAKARKARRKR
jgi:general stress protein YciG